MLWLYLLGAVTVLTIALRRVLRRQKPLDDELYSKSVAIEQLPTGVAWVRVDGTFGSVNPAFAKTLKMSAAELIGKEWYEMFPPDEHNRIRDAYAQTLLMGVQTFTALGMRPDGSTVRLNVRLVAVHDHNLRFAGHHCLIEDRTHEHDLEQLLNELSASKSGSQALERPLAVTR